MSAVNEELSEGLDVGSVSACERVVGIRLDYDDGGHEYEFDMSGVIICKLIPCALVIVPIREGTNDVRIHFRRTTDRTIGDAISWISLILLGTAWIKTRPKRIIVKSSLCSRPGSDRRASA